MDFSEISNKSFLGKTLRLPLKFLPAQMKMPIMRGKLRGKKWIIGSGNHGCWLGSYEYYKQKLFEKTIPLGSVVYDLGGHVGFYSLLASELVGPAGKVFVFEPVPRNVFYLREHLRLNNVSNVIVIEAAVSDQSGIVTFDEGPNNYMGRMALVGNLQVKAITLDELYSKKEIPLPDYIKIDIEGGELLALKGAYSILRESHASIFLATHSGGVHKDCCQYLQSLGYRLKPIDGKNIDFSRELYAIYHTT
jgi:FkbM family methyltransferase